MITKPRSFSYALNEDQKRAVHASNRGIQIVAPAGSGKTETLVHRAIELIRTKGVLPRQLLILSFDNSARHGFEQKYRRYAQGLALPTVKTINKFGNDLLKQHFSKDVGTLNQESALRRSYDHRYAYLDVLHWDGRHRNITGAFDALKYQGFAIPDLRQNVAREWLRRHFLQLPDENESISATDLWDLDDTPKATEQFNADIDQILETYRSFEQEMRDQGWMDFADQKLRPLVALRRDASVRAEVQGQYREIVVDECQDISRLDALLIRFVLGPETTLVVAGDDDQSLYEFREANSLYLREPSRYFERDFEACHLNINYRTPQELLEPALRLIDHNGERIPKTPHSGVAHSGELKVLRTGSDLDLVRKVVEGIVDLTKRIGADRVSPEEIGVLCAASTSVTRYRRALTSAGIPWTEAVRSDSGQRVTSGVTVDTMRKAKGRQWRVVIIPDALDASMPGPQSMRNGDTESERRMFYVAMTRPSEHLVVGYSSKEPVDIAYRASDGEIVGTNGASRFLFEAGLISEPNVSHPHNPAFEAEAPQLDRSTTITEMGHPTMALSAPIANVATESPINRSSPIPANSNHSLDQTTGLTFQAPPIDSPVSRVPSLIQADSVRTNGRFKPWDLRESERRAMDKAQMRVLGDDHEYAAVDAFDKAIVPFLKRNVRTLDGSGIEKTESKFLIDLLGQQRVVDTKWLSTLHEWRMARNRCVHDSGPPSLEVINRVKGMVERAPDLFAYIRDHQSKVASSTSVPGLVGIDAASQPEAATRADATDSGPIKPPLIDAERLRRIGLLADIIQTQQPHPKTGKRVKSLRFDPDTFREEMLVLQLHFLLRDVRFHIAESYRWSSSPIFAQLSLRELQYCHASIRGTSRHGLQPLQRSRSDELVDILSELLEDHFGGEKTGAFRIVLNDSVGTQNGNYPAGFKIRAYRVPNTP